MSVNVMDANFGLAEDHGEKVGFLTGYYVGMFKIRDPSKRPTWWRESLELLTLNSALLDRKKMHNKGLVTTQKDGMFYINRVLVDVDHRGHDIGLKLVADTMMCLREHVGCCTILPFPLNDEGRLTMPATTDEAREKEKERMAKLGCYSSKIGFRQCGKEYPQAQQFWLERTRRGRGVRLTEWNLFPSIACRACLADDLVFRAD